MPNEIKTKPTLIYYEILKYQAENIKLLDENFEVISLPNPTCDTAEMLGKADVVLAPLGYYFGREKIDESHNLKVIASNTTGHPHIDVDYAEKKGIKVITLKEYRQFLQAITPTAELTWGLIIALTRNMFPAYQSVLRGEWNRRPFGGSSMLSRMNLGVAGYGRLGTMVASYGISFGMKVRYYDPFVSSGTPRIERVETLGELVRISDIVTIHISHEPDTERLFNKDIFSNFKKGSYLINTSRGELIDHKALLDSLTDGTLAGAAIDVFEGEFQGEFRAYFNKHPLLNYARNHSNLIITPHIGGSTVDAWRLTEEFTINEVIRLMKEQKDMYKKERVANGKSQK